MASTEVELTAEVVRALLLDQHPDLAERHLSLGARGWDNQLWRLGDDLAVRLPWQTDAADLLLLKESTWVPVLAPLLPLPIPVPQRLGQPTERYPHPWIVTTWVPGTSADRASVTNGSQAAESLAAFLAALHQPAPDSAPEGRFGRGGPLAQFAEGVERSIAGLSDIVNSFAETTPTPDLDSNAVRAIWEDALAAPSWEGPPLWLHGDLHPANVATSGGDLCGVIDFGDLCAGDPALDLAAAWILLPGATSIERFRTANPLAADDATWRRARGWAVWRAIGCLRIAIGGPPGGKPSWGPPALTSLQHLIAS
jgi:aminoglycoside phosphotransferase (APT) family kinase protein